MPRVFQHPPGQVIPQLRGHEPVAVAHVLGPRPLPDGLPADGELGAAGDANCFRDGLVGEQLLKCLLVDALGVDGLCLVLGGVVLDGADLGRAAEDPDASQVDVALGAEVLEAEALEEREGVVVGVVVVPLETLGVVEDDVAGEGVVAVDDVPDGGRSLVFFSLFQVGWIDCLTSKRP